MTVHCRSQGNKVPARKNLNFSFAKFSFRLFLGFFIAFGAIFLFLPGRVLAQVVINELLPNPADGPDWIELYNTTNQDVDLGEWILDDEGTATNMVDIKEATISAQGFLVFAVGNRLNKSSDTIYLKDKQELTVDEYRYIEDPGSDISFGRMPDGGEWGLCQAPTKGGSNSCILPTPTPIPTSTPQPTSASGPSDTPTPIPNTPKLSTPTPTSTSHLTPTPKSTKKTEATLSGEVLGEESTPAAFYPWEATEEAEASAEASPSGKNRWLSKVFLGLGFILLFAAAFYVWYTQLRE